MNENEPGYCRQHGVRRDECGCGHIPHLVQVMFDGDTTTPYCLCGWEGARWLTTITTSGWASASLEGREHAKWANQQAGGGGAHKAKPLHFRRSMQAGCSCGWTGPIRAKESWDYAYREWRGHVNQQGGCAI